MLILAQKEEMPGMTCTISNDSRMRASDKQTRQNSHFGKVPNKRVLCLSLIKRPHQQQSGRKGCILKVDRQKLKEYYPLWKRKGDNKNSLQNNKHNSKQPEKTETSTSQVRLLLEEVGWIFFFRVCLCH